MRMTDRSFYVFCVGGRWKFKCGRREQDADDRASAMLSAILAAHEAGERGSKARVMCRGEDAQWRAEWTYGRDRLPTLHPDRARS
ncbi:hypothetical protein [Plastoroseomonas hellenica]|uniref:hypothetical protein n=1 Tax=Plastoroseomonas hellenica TaxID=2687306 RepID=UPI001BA9D23E|nr:hypothetical protein [Plastoroseomonas hellenica]MBR0641422.1 DUF2188 domain-containing protein [Plastoroseomonas hellenica]